MGAGLIEAVYLAVFIVRYIHALMPPNAVWKSWRQV